MGMSCFLASKGADLVLCTRDADKAAAVNNDGLRCGGDLEGSFRIKAVTDPQRAVTNAKVILVTTNARGRRDAAFQMRSLAEEGQTVLIFGGYWGAWEFRMILGGAVRRLDLTVAETSSQIFESTAEAGNVRLRFTGNTDVSAADPDATAGLAESLRDLFPQFIPAPSILYTSLSAARPIVTASVIMNRIADTRHEPAELLARLEEERLGVASALGQNVPGFPEDPADACAKAESAFEQDRKSVTDRFLSEDVPFWLAPLSQLGRLAGKPTPAADGVIGACAAVYGDSLLERGPILRKEDLPL